MIKEQVVFATCSFYIPALINAVVEILHKFIFNHFARTLDVQH
jgi:hypothetical protein